MLKIQLLGPIEASCGDRQIVLGGAKPRTLFAALVLARGKVVPADRLIDVVWPSDPPRRARSLVQTYISTLRTSFASHGLSQVIVTRPPGYAANLDGAEVDADAFTHLVGEARALMKKGDLLSVAHLLDEAIGLWRGQALSGTDSPLMGEAILLDELLTSAYGDRFEVELRLGRLDHVAELTALVARHPADEKRQSFHEALSRFRAIHNVRGQAAALTGLGVCCREPGLLAEAKHFLEQAASLVLALGDHGGTGYVHRLKGSVLLEQGDYPAARSDLDRSLAAYQEMGSQRGVALTLRTLGMYHRARGDYPAALEACAESAAIFDRCGDELMHSYAMRAHAKAQLRFGDAAQALPCLENALAVTRAYGDRWGQACNLHVLGQLHLSERQLDLAVSCLDAATSIWDVLETPLWRARTRYARSLVHQALGETEAAQAARAEALEVFHGRGAREYLEIIGN